jgi:metal-responsive CopG/Arc/MetJ family transcriptional regulator
MPTEKPILNFAIDKELKKRLEDFRFENRINTMSEAIRRLLDEALKKYEKNSPDPSK